MGKIVVVLMLAALALIAAAGALETSAIQTVLSAISADANIGTVNPPLMYAGIRG